MIKILIKSLLLLVFFTSSSLADITSGLVAHYEFEGNLNNSSGNENNATGHGTLDFVDGVIGNGIQFNEYLDLLETNSTLLSNQTNTTISIWIRTDQNSNFIGILSTIKGTGNDNEYLIGLEYGNIRIEIHDSALDLSTVKINDGFYHLITLVTTADSVSLYIDGVLDNQSLISIGNFEIDSSIWLGNDQDSLNGSWDSDQQFNGIMDDLRFYNRSLSSTDVTALYELGSSNILSNVKIHYADTILDSYYSGVNPDFDTFYGGDADGGPKLVPLSYAVDADETTAISLPTDSYLTVGFSKVAIVDAANQDDLYIVEAGSGGEDADVYVSSDFNNFTYLGLAQDDVTTSFDLADIGFTTPVVAVKVVGKDNGGSWPGFDLHEVKGLAGSVIEYDDQCKIVKEIYAKSPNTGKWILFSNPCDLPVGWETSAEKPLKDVLCNNKVVVIPMF